MINLHQIKPDVPDLVKLTAVGWYKYAVGVEKVLKYAGGELYYKYSEDSSMPMGPGWHILPKVNWDGWVRYPGNRSKIEDFRAEMLIVE